MNIQQMIWMGLLPVLVMGGIWMGLLPVLVMGGYIVALIRNIRKYK